jgi:anti-sigma regulatory factor (Ser/Thr protein kinase)
MTASSNPHPALCWGRDFPGDADQVREARHWIEDLLPECDPLADLLLLASELCSNAITHTRSGLDGGLFSVHVEWAPALARVVIGDQGSPTLPAIGAGTGDTAEECGRGLWLVDQLADSWGTACHPAGRVVWVDMSWRARGGPPLQAPAGTDAAAAADITVLREEFPGITIWWGHQTQAWWAALPEATGPSSLISSPAADALGKVLADACSPFRRDPQERLLAARCGSPRSFGPYQPENAQGR